MCCVDVTCERTSLRGDTSASVTQSQHLSKVNSLSHKFNVQAITTPSTRVSYFLHYSLTFFGSFLVCP